MSRSVRHFSAATGTRLVRFLKWKRRKAVRDGQEDKGRRLMTGTPYSPLNWSWVSDVHVAH